MGYFFSPAFGVTAGTQPLPDADLGPVTVLAHDQIVRLRCKLGPGQRTV